MSKRLVFFCVTAVGTQIAHASSNHSLEATVWATTNYMFRGITNTDNNPAIQGEVDYFYEPLNLYTFVWASNIKLTDVDTHIEIDYGLGFTDQITDQSGWDIGAIYYHYPGAGGDLEFDYLEVYGEFNYSFDNVLFSPYLRTIAWYSPNFFGEDGSAAYFEANIELTLPQEFFLIGHAGYQGVNGDKYSGPEGYDYFDFSIDLKKQILGVNWIVSYSNTINQFDACGSTRDCDHQIFITLEKTFD